MNCFMPLTSIVLQISYLKEYVYFGQFFKLVVFNLTLVSGPMKIEEIFQRLLRQN